MPLLRLDPVRRRWVITGKRPAMPDALDSGELCPFCPGNESFTPASIREHRDANGHWDVRVFHDRAPLFRVEGGLNREGEGIYDRMNAVGAHEIVVETNQHGKPLAELAPQHIACVLEICRDRILDLKQDLRFRYVSMFKDQGRVRPAGEEHSHSQVLAVPVIPTLVERELRWSLFHYQRKERCIYCDILYQETRLGTRVVDENPDFVCLCPYASRFPYEIWVLPVQHFSAFERDMAAGPRLHSLARFLKTALLRVQKVSSKLRLSLHTEPNLAAYGTETTRWKTVRDDYHWHFEIYPELDGESDHFDAESFYYNPIPAEDAALALRSIEVEAENSEVPAKSD
ncbi:MAG: galactose-1-phosphate uridylyltransferase [Acidobacteria bacterium]|nr:MAG: galactose-1-phosphate uridylyltransferase [Acidobacteriota bacterium]